MKHKTLSTFLSSALIASSLALTACGPQAFVPNTSLDAQKAAGQMNIPPKVDIVLGMSSNGTMRNIYPGIANEIPAFLKNLQNSGWDYRFVSLPLAEKYLSQNSNPSISGQVTVSNYDANYPASSWLAPYPGATIDTAPKIASYLFANLFYVTQPAASDRVDAHESGFNNELKFLGSSTVRNDFLRPDAMLAVMTISNGEDRSDWNWGAPDTTDIGSPQHDANYYASEFKAIKSNIKYFSVVAHYNTNCRGGTSWSGIRYESVANTLGGQAVDLCTVSLSDSLAAVKANLDTYHLSFVKDYLVIANAPNVNTIVVTKYAGGNASQATTIPKDDVNGWSYDGPVPNGGVYTIESPVPMDLVTSGYLIKLHGSAKLVGNDSSSVTFTNAGTVTSN